jgi:hypothetical protein
MEFSATEKEVNFNCPFPFLRLAISGKIKKVNIVPDEPFSLP